ncbi:Zn-dependent peptidase ImmA, M78 family [Quadrisphaera granulorum]|uniref:Zn-dependent peptidase ImmA (M78 family) n=1 Tax=Quadrisphaera granulorum TaxID=317664 RepID=A0A316A558_9ACTN|nr:XRE family transcriptional regulator [Quadrisphaera granulorum]PWJ52825.1 Zn-dependent peptidase ImmA (M78 family) [Quadrisphaera granulorum]SZE97430.1 Zn-dependent peptidase ImmA, M78 family [Quadrisphaera granulorum]
MNNVELGLRLTQARDEAGLTQAQVARTIGVDRSAISRLEKGERNLNARELVVIAEALGRPLSYFVSEAPPAVVSRRRDAGETHPSTTQLDAELLQFSTDVFFLADLRLLVPATRPAGRRTPHDHMAAESLASRIRRHLDLGSSPITDLGDTCERLGLLVHVTSLGVDGAPGACVEVETPAGPFGVAVVNADDDSGRRRMTLAHELGHWLCGDAYDASGSLHDERMLNSFAIHLLAPRAGVVALWNELAPRSHRERAIDVAARYMVSWTAVLGHLKTLDLIDEEDRRQLADRPPTKGDYLHRNIRWHEHLQLGYLSPSFVDACLSGYSARRLTAARTTELLRGTVTRADLPEQEAPEWSDLRPSFTGHGG